MTGQAKCAVLWLGLALGFVGCGSAKTSDYYTLSAAPPPASASNPAAQQELGVAPPRASHLLRQDRIVYFTQENQLNYYHYHRWAESPVFLVQKLLIQHLQGAGVFDHVVPYRAQKGLDYVLRGQLLHMEEVDLEEEIRARFALELELVRQEDRRVIWSERQACERAVPARTVASVVDTLSQCADRVLDSLTESLNQAVAQENSRQEQAESR